MRNGHLTHEEMQAWVMQDGLGQPNTTLAAHLSGCKRCQEEVAAYRLMIPMLETLPAAAFDFDVAEMVLENLPERKVGVSLGMIMVYIMLGMGVLIGVGGLVMLTRYLQFNLVAGLGAIVVIGFLGVQLKEMAAEYQRQVRLLEHCE